MKDISCRMTLIAIKGLEKHNISPEILCEGIPYDVDFLKNRHENIEWDVYCKFMSNIRKILLNDDDFTKLGIQMITWRLVPVLPALAGFFLNVRELYWMNTEPKGIGSQYFRCIIPSIRDIDKGHLEIVLELPPGYQYCKEFFLITKGFFIAFPLFLKLNPSKVTMRETERGAVYRIAYPQSNTIMSWIQRFLLRVFSKHSAMTELSEAYELLYDRYDQLEESREKIQLQAKQLEIAYSIGQLIGKDLDLDNTINDVAESLVNIAGFVAVEVNVDTLIDNEQVKRFVRSGNRPVGSPPLRRKLEAHGNKIGEILLWPHPNSKTEDAEQLLEYIIPTISMETLNAISFKILDNYRSKLEIKVTERTGQLNEANKELASTVERLKNLKSTRDRFFAGISHEFRTPLTLILGPSDQLLAETSNERITKQANLIRQNAFHLLGLINQLLELSKLEAGKLKLEASESNIVPFITGVVHLFDSIAEHKDINLKVHLENESIHTYFNKHKMMTVISNLLFNSLKFTPDGGEIRVSVKIIDNPHPNGTLEIKVRDNGIGISEEELPRIFDRFYQVEHPYAGDLEGTGIGLALTKELVELHHGTINVESRKRNTDSNQMDGFDEKGWTEFTIKLKLGRDHLQEDEIIKVVEITEEESLLKKMQEQIEIIKADPLLFLKDAGVKEPERDADIENEGSDKMIILVVEDNAEVRNLIRDSLGKEFLIDEASDGEQGIRKAEKIIPDLIISDIMMPKIDGNELTRILKNDEKTSHIPVILLTAKSGQENKIEGLETGADDYLTKPFDTNELQVRIKNLISIRRKLQEKYSKGDFISVKRVEGKKLTNLEEQFMSKVMKVIESHLSEEEFSVEQLGNELFMSRVQIFRKIKALTGVSPNKFITSQRLFTARGMILEKKGTISEIAYSVGFGSPTYFTRRFKEEFGYLPSDLIK